MARRTDRSLVARLGVKAEVKVKVESSLSLNLGLNLAAVASGWSRDVGMLRANGDEDVCFRAAKGV